LKISSEQMENDRGHKGWYRKWKPYFLLINVLTLAAILWYACLTQRIWKEMHNQVSLMHHQLAGTMGASVSWGAAQIVNDDFTHAPMLVMRIDQTGHAAAPEAHIIGEFQILSLPDLNLLSSIPIHEVFKPLNPGGNGARYPLEGFTRLDERVSTQTKTVTVKVKVGFDNGFGDRVGDQEFCFSYIGVYSFRDERGQIEENTNQTGDFVDCKEFKARMSYLRRQTMQPMSPP